MVKSIEKKEVSCDWISATAKKCKIVFSSKFKMQMNKANEFNERKENIYTIMKVVYLITFNLENIRVATLSDSLLQNSTLKGS